MIEEYHHQNLRGLCYVLYAIPPSIEMARIRNIYSVILIKPFFVNYQNIIFFEKI